MRSVSIASVALLVLASSAIGQAITIDPSRRAQTIDGWGASSAWYGDNYMTFSEEMRAAFVDYLFGDDGLGLNIHRVRVPRMDAAPDGSPIDWTDKKLVGHARFLRYVQDRHDPVLFASCWTPPERMKTNGHNEGGKLEPDAYDDFAEYLAAYVTGLREHYGVEVDILSPQNEPDEAKRWDSCVWTPDELARFVGEHLGPTFEREAPRVKLLVGEDTAWRDTFPNAVLADAAAAGHVNLVGGHLYHGSHDDPKVFQRAADRRLPLWQTEFYLGDYRFPRGEPIDEHVRTLWLGEIMHDTLVHSEVNAYFFWWLLSPANKGVQGLLNTDATMDATTWHPTSRAYGFGQFSRFVRPGAVRLELEDDKPADGLFVSAFVHDADGTITLVVVNRSQEQRELEIRLPNDGAGVLEVVRTSREEQMATINDVAIDDGSAKLPIAPESITTFQTRGRVAG